MLWPLRFWITNVMCEIEIMYTHTHAHTIYPSRTSINIHCISAFHWPFISGVKSLTCIKLIEQIPQHFYRCQNAQSDHGLLIKQHKRATIQLFRSYDWMREQTYTFVIKVKVYKTKNARWNERERKKTQTKADAVKFCRPDRHQVHLHRPFSFLNFMTLIAAI